MSAKDVTSAAAGPLAESTDIATVTVMSRDLTLAREAYKEMDGEKSRLAHQVRLRPRTTSGSSEEYVVTTEVPAREEHIKSGEYVRSLVFGGMDGIITTFAIVAGSRGASLNTATILALGFANVVADGISMGFGDFISSQAEREYARKEWKREKFEMENYPEGEKLEMIELYQSKGMTREDATAVIEIMAKYTNLFVDHMVVHELGLQIPDESDKPWKNGLVTFCSFLVFGTVPLLSYIAFHAIDFNTSFDVEFFIACILTCISLFGLGVIKSRFESARWWTSGLWVLFNGFLAAGSAYLIGWGLAELLGANTCG